ncbi:hypothetical protein NLG97_g10804 [Lecanicillium saksenae]|uniref:Uncharacterized protein n=1 Tax=Lecanicillium saksenae TaxID=468837 RepID=A0ACC1QDJ9_9HYPO|nr:hypothetical protein NLG97_g10804 [Lecanicillium saksenae]
MWRLPVNFVTLHYAYIIFMGLLGLVVLYPAGNMPAIDAYFFGASGSTESGLNTKDVKDLYTYQQLYIYFIPILTNLGFINIIVVIVRLHWFKKHLNKVAPRFLGQPEDDERDVETGYKSTAVTSGADVSVTPDRKDLAVAQATIPATQAEKPAADEKTGPHIAFDASAVKEKHPKNDATLYIPRPRDRDQGHPLVELDNDYANNKDGKLRATVYLFRNL